MIVLCLSVGALPSTRITADPRSTGPSVTGRRRETCPLSNAGSPLAARLAPAAVRRPTRVRRHRGFIVTLMNWVVTDGVGYLGWARNVRDRSNRAPRISDDGTARAYGRGPRIHLAAASN